MNAKFARTLLAVLSISALILAGCNSDSTDSNPMAPTDTSTAGTTGTTGTTGAGTIDASNIGAVQTALTAAITGALLKGPGAHNGTKNGTVTVTVAIGKPTQMVFANYSDDGLLFIDGPLAIDLNLATQSRKITGDLSLSGAYSAKVSLDLTITTTGTTGSVTVDGQKFPVGG